MFVPNTWIKKTGITHLSASPHESHLLDIALGIANWHIVCVTGITELNLDIFRLYKPRKSVIVFVDFDIPTTRFVDFIDISGVKTREVEIENLLDAIRDIAGWHVVKF